jgi:hypothetical protein
VGSITWAAVVVWRILRSSNSGENRTLERVAARLLALAGLVFVLHVANTSFGDWGRGPLAVTGIVLSLVAGILGVSSRPWHRVPLILGSLGLACRFYVRIDVDFSLVH